MKVIIVIIVVYTLFNIDTNVKGEDKMKIEIEFQYFEGCPHYKNLEKNLDSAIALFEDKIIVNKIEINTIEMAKDKKFRGSPTIVINGEDFENMELPKEIGLTCRYYSNGIPTKEEIIKKINSFIE